MLLQFFRYDYPGNDIGNHPDTNREEGKHHPDDPDQVRVGIVILADPAADSAKEPLCFRAVEPFHERKLGRNHVLIVAPEQLP